MAILETTYILHETGNEPVAPASEISRSSVEHGPTGVFTTTVIHNQGDAPAAGVELGRWSTVHSQQDSNRRIIVDRLETRLQPIGRLGMLLPRMVRDSS